MTRRDGRVVRQGRQTGHRGGGAGQGGQRGPNTTAAAGLSRVDKESWIVIAVRRSSRGLLRMQRSAVYRSFGSKQHHPALSASHRRNSADRVSRLPWLAASRPDGTERFCSQERD